MSGCSHIRIIDSSKTLWNVDLGKNEIVTIPFRYEGSTYKCTTVEHLVNEGGVTNVGCLIHSKKPQARIGTMVAGNSGHPAGACGGHDGEIGILKANYTTQEEDVISNWLITKSLREQHYSEKKVEAFRRVGSRVYKDTIYKKWGFNGTTETRTIQGIDYTTCEPEQYGDAWIVADVQLSEKVQLLHHIRHRTLRYDTDCRYPTTLVFVSGPNCNARGAKESCTTRTFNRNLMHDYHKFRSGVFWALKAGLTAMAADRCTVALVASVSCGIYAPQDFKGSIQHEFRDIVQSVLQTQVDESGLKLGCCFERVIHVTLS